MTKSKNTKRALLMSVLSMVLCMAMLVGSTFAWFTDTVTSGKNRIVAGKLDIELEYSFTGADDSWKTVNANTNLFISADETLWEPGHTEYAYLRIKNAGSLALKYAFDVNVYGDEAGEAEEKSYTNKDGGTFKLSEQLVFSKKDGTAAITDRSELWLNPDAEDDAKGNLSGLKDTGVLMPGAQEAFTLSVYMPASVGNEANQLTDAIEEEGAPTIYLGLTLKATQAIAENDSFGNDYDANADGSSEWENATIVKATAAVNPEDEATLISIGLVSVYVSNESAAGDSLVLTAVPTETSEEFVVASGKDTQAYEISVEGLKENNDTPIKVTLYEKKDLTGVVVYHNNELIDSEYDPATGIITFETVSFSPFTVVYDKVAGSDTTEITTVEDLQAAINETGDVRLTDDLTHTNSATLGAESRTPVIAVAENGTANVDFDGNKLTIDSASGRNGIMAAKNATLILSDGTVEQNKAYGSTCAVIWTEKGNVVLNNMTVENSTKDGVTVSAGSDGGVLEIYGSTIIGGGKYNDAVFCGSQSDVLIEGSTIIGCIRAANNCTIEINGGDYTQATFDSQYNYNIVIYNGLFSFDPSDSTEVILAGDTTYVTDNGDGTWSVATLDEGDFEDPFS